MIENDVPIPTWISRMIKFNASIFIGFSLLVLGTLALALYLIKRVTMKSNNAFIMLHFVMYMLDYSTAIV